MITPEGRGRVAGLNLLDRVLKIKLYGKDVTIDYDYDELKEFAEKQEVAKAASGKKEEANG